MFKENEVELVKKITAVFILVFAVSCEKHQAFWERKGEFLGQKSFTD